MRDTLDYIESVIDSLLKNKDEEVEKSIDQFLANLVKMLQTVVSAEFLTCDSGIKTYMYVIIGQALNKFEPLP